MTVRPSRSRRWLGAIVAALAIVLATSLGARAQSASPRLSPIDQAAARPDFLEFRNGLRDVVRRKDVAALLRVVHPNIKNSFGGDDGIDAFKAKWRLESSTSELWRELAAALALGGTFDDTGNFTAPYVFSRWPDRFDAFEHVAVIGSGVRVRSAPTTTATVSARVSYAILEIDPWPRETEGWKAVRLPGGGRGFVSAGLVRSPVDYRAFFTRENGRWLMTLFLAGD